MRGLLIALTVLSVCLSSAQQNQKGKKPPDVQVVETKCHRGEEKMAVDGRVRISAEKPLKGLVLAFDFLSTEGGVLTTAKYQISEEPLEPGEEPSFHAEILSPPGAVKYRLRAFDAFDKELRIGGGGPYSIE